MSYEKEKEVTIGTFKKFGHLLRGEHDVRVGGVLVFDEDTNQCVGMEEPHYRVGKLWQDGSLVKGHGLLID
jgi:hypothetical protein